MAVVEEASGASSSKSGGTGGTIGVDASRVANRLLVVTAAFDNASATTPTVTLNKPAGETNNWTIVHHNSPQASSTLGVRGATAYILTTTDDWSSHNLALTLSLAATAKGWTWRTLSGVTATERAAATVRTGAGSLVTGAGTLVGDVVLVCASSEAPSGTPPTITSAHETLLSPQTGGTTGGSGVTNATSKSDYAIVGTAGARTFTLGTVTDGGGVIVTLIPAEEPPFVQSVGVPIK
jgi:hypothetical protein